MIAASADNARLTAGLVAKAKAIASVRLSARRDDPRRWRRAGWLWPLFAKDSPWKPNCARR